MATSIFIGWHTAGIGYEGGTKSFPKNSSCADDQPLHERSENLFAEAERERLLQDVLRHPRLLGTVAGEADETALSGAFAGTRGFLLKFNLEGAAPDRRAVNRLRAVDSSPASGCLTPTSG